MNDKTLSTYIQNSFIYHQNDIIITPNASSNPTEELTTEPPMQAALRYRKQYPDAKIVVLDPGGPITPISTTFEGEYFSSDTLVNILRSDYFEERFYKPHRRRDAFNGGLGINEAIYIPNVPVREGEPETASVLVCPPPIKREEDTPELSNEYLRTLGARIVFIKKILENLKTDIAILTPFGQEPNIVANLYSWHFFPSTISTIVYSAPDNPRDYNAFLLPFRSNLKIYKGE